MCSEKLTGVAFFQGKNNFLYIGNIKSYQSQVVDLQLSKELRVQLWTKFDLSHLLDHFFLSPKPINQDGS